MDRTSRCRWSRREREREGEEDGQGVAKFCVGPEASVEYGHHVQEDDDANISTNGDRSRVFFRSSLEKEDVVERNGDTVPSSKRKLADAFICYTVKRKRNLLKESVRKRDGNSVSIVLTQQNSSQKTVFRSWKKVNLAGVNPDILVGRKCKVYWPMDEGWYQGIIVDFSEATQKHHVDYDDGDEENLLLAKESVKLYLSHDEWRFLTQQSHSATLGKKKIDYQEIAALAAGVEVHGEYGHGEVVWVKIKGHPTWPALVLDEEHASACGLETPAREGLLAIQFFGSYDYSSSNYIFPLRLE